MISKTAEHHLEKLLTEAEVAAALGLKSRKVLWQLRKAGKIRFVALGRVIRYRAADVQAMIDGAMRRRR